jgi:hypothetical protein
MYSTESSTVFSRVKLESAERRENVNCAFGINSDPLIASDREAQACRVILLITNRPDQRGKYKPDSGRRETVADQNRLCSLIDATEILAFRFPSGAREKSHHGFDSISFAHLSIVEKKLTSNTSRYVFSGSSAPFHFPLLRASTRQRHIAGGHRCWIAPSTHSAYPRLATAG